MTFLVTNPDNEPDGGTLELDGASSVASADVGGFTYVFVAGGVDDGISVFRLLANGTLTPVHDVTDAGALELDGARGLSTAMVDGNTYLFVAGQADNGVSVFRVNTNGSLTNVSNVTDDVTMLLTGVSDTATARVGTSTYLYTAGTTENGISIFRVAGDGRLTYLSNLADAGAMELAGVRALTQVTIGATAFLIAGGTDDGISVFSINASTGALTATDNEDDSGSVNLNDVSDITTAVIGGVTYVFVAGAADNGVSVFSLSAAGVLTHLESESDSAASLIAGANSVTVTVLGGITYLHVGGTENGTSLYQFIPTETAGRILQHVDPIADNGSRELSGPTTTGTASVGGTTYLLGVGSTDDGISTFGSTTTGQVWYSTAGLVADARVAYFNSDGGNHITVIDNNPSPELTTGFIEAVALNSAAGLYYILATGHDGLNAKLLMGHIGSTAAPTVVFTFDAAFGTGTIPPGSVGENNLAFGIEIDTINERLYIGYIEFENQSNVDTFGNATQGIRQFTYNVTTGAVTGGAFFVTETTANTPGSAPGVDGLFASRDLDIDTTNNVIYSQSLLLGDGFETNAIMRFSLSNPTGSAGVSVVNPALFPMNGDGGDFTTLNGIIADIEVDEASNRLYFLTRAEDVEEAGGEDSIWMVANASTASNATPVEVTLVGSAAFPFTLANFYPTDMIMDEVNNILYIESENSNLPGGGLTDVILVFQLDAAGTTATLINSINMAFNATANVEGLHFNYLADLGALTATGTAAVEQSVSVDLLSASPSISDFDGDHLASATVQITGGTFNSNENSFNDDDLGYSASMTQSGLIAGTNITISWTQATGTLTLTGYDTFANYQAALNSIHFQSTGNNPTNYGLNPFRTITWTISDGLPGIPGGQENSGTTTLNITAVNDGPTNTVPGAQVMNEDAPLSITGIQVSDPDANPGIADITVTITATNGIVTLLTNVVGGLIAADIANNGTGLVTITATINEINATFAAASGFVFTNTPDYNGPASVQIVTNDGGNTGTGGALQDSDTINITVNAVVDIANDAPSFAEDSGAQNFNLLANDSFENAGRAITSVTQGLHGTVTINNNGTAGDLTDDFVVYTQVADYNGADSFTYTVTSGGVTETATVNITISAVADIANDALNLAEDDPTATIDVLANDSFENAARFISGVTQGLHGTVTIIDGPDADGIMDYVTYTPVADYNGADSFTYTVTSGDVTETATVNVNISAVADIADDSITVLEDSGANNLNGIANISLLANDSFENAGRAITAVTQGTNGSVAINNNGTAGDATDDFAVYTPNANYGGPDSFTYTVTSGGVTETATVTVSVTAINDAPVNTVGGAAATNEDNAVVLTGISIADLDADPATAPMSFVLSVTNGTIFINTGVAGGITAGNIIAGANGTATMSITATQNQINATLTDAAGLTFTPTANYNGSAELTVTTSDQGATGLDPGATGGPGDENDIDVKTITIAAVNDAPSGADNADTTVDTVDLVFDAANFSTGMTDVEGHTLASVIITTLPATGTIKLSNVAIIAGAEITLAQLTAGNLTYTPPGIGSGGTSPTFTFQVRDNGGIVNGGVDLDGSPNTFTINITASNIAPAVDLDGAGGTNDFSSAYTEDGAAAAVTDTDVDITDGDGATIASATITITDAIAGDTLTLSGPLPGTITVDGTSTPTVLKLAGAGTHAEYEQALALVHYSSTSNNPTALGTDPTRTVTVIVNDGVSPSAASTTTITITDVNDPPAGTDGTITALEDSFRLLAAADFGFLDADGTIAGVTISGVTGGGIWFDADGSAGAGTPVLETLPKTYTAQDLLDGKVSFKAGQDANGAGIGTITFAVTDDDGATDASPNTLTVDVTPLNDSPVVPDSPTIAVNEQTTITLNATIAVSDIDLDARNGGAGDYGGASFVINRAVPSADDLFNFDPTSGALFTVNGSNLEAGGLVFATFSQAGGILTVDFTSSGTAATTSLVNNLLGHLQYTNLSNNPPSSVTLNYVLDDGAPDAIQGAIGGAAADGGQIVVNLNAVNDAPVNVLGGGIGTGEDAINAWLSGMSISDPDANPATDDIFITFDVDHGTLGIRTDVVNGINAIDVISQTATTITVQATINQINATLTASNGLVYSPDLNYNGSDTLTVTTNDRGFTEIDPGFSGNAGSEEDIDTRTIIVSAVDDLPDAQPDAVTTPENAVGTGSLFVNNGSGPDSDAEGDAFVITAVNGSGGAVGTEIILASGAKLIVNADGTYSYNPNGKFNTLTNTSSGETGAVNTQAVDTFTYTLNGGDTATVTMTITGVVSPEDRLEGDSGNNTITGTPGNDYFFVVQGGDDTLSGLAGNDFFFFGAALTGNDAADGGAGNDQIAIQGIYNVTFGPGIVGMESLVLLPGNDLRFGDTAGNFYDYAITTVDANVAAGARLIVDANRLRAGEDFTFNGSAEADGNFFIVGGNGVDLLTGGAQSDTFLFGENGQWGGSDVVNGGPAGTNDQLALRGNYTITFGAGQLINIDSIALVSAFDTRFGQLGAEFDYNLTMNNGNVATGQQMTIDAAPLRSNESLTFNGSAELNGSFRVAGGAGNDVIIGSAGADILIGRGGVDTMTGGAGSDQFRYNETANSTPTAKDVIQDFTTGDTIDLSRIDAIAGTPTNDAFTFIGAAAFSNVAGQLRATAAGATWTVQGDINGDSIADFELTAIVSDASPITNTDFFL